MLHFQCTSAELRRHGVQGDAIAGSLDQTCLTRTYHHSLDTPFIFGGYYLRALRRTA